jgi:hypothetical protein
VPDLVEGLRDVKEGSGAVVLGFESLGDPMDNTVGLLNG